MDKKNRWPFTTPPSRYDDTILFLNKPLYWWGAMSVLVLCLFLVIASIVVENCEETKIAEDIERVYGSAMTFICTHINNIKHVALVILLIIAIILVALDET